MPALGIVCPFCNCQFGGGVDRLKPVCPRCEAPLLAGLVEQLGANPSLVVVLTPTVPGKKKTLLALLALMLTMASLTVAYTFWTQSFRRQNDVKKSFVVAEAASSVPVEMAALGLLPAKCNILGAVNLVDLRTNPLAKAAFLEHSPRSIEWLRERLKDSTGLSLDDLDQVAVGIEMTDFLPKIFVIVQTHAVYDPEAVLKPFAPAKSQMLRKRPLVRFQLSPVGDGICWCVSDRHIAFLFRIEPGKLDDLEAIPVQPRQKLEGSSEAIKAIVEDRVDKQSLAWLAADLKSAKGLLDLLSLAGARVEAYRPLLDAKALAINIKTDRDIVVLGHVLAGSEKGVKPLETYLRDLDWRGAASTKIESTPPDAGAEPWVTMQLRYEPASIRDLLKKGPGTP